MTVFLERWVAMTMVIGGVLGCKDLTGSPGLPAGTPNPATYYTAAGALGMRNAAIFTVEQGLPQYILDAGLLTDELEDANTGTDGNINPNSLGSNNGDVADPLDERILPVGTSGGTASYGKLQDIREFAAQALGALATYDTAAADTTTSKVMRGELYAMEGYAEIMLADLFCSGVPLSYLVFQGNFTYEPGESTSLVYQDAVAKLDTALLLAQASDSVTDLALVLKGRAKTDLGQYTAAADDVSIVPDIFQYQLTVNWSSGTGTGCPNLLNCTATVSDREGVNGLPFLSSNDPRTAAIGAAVDDNTGDSLFFPAKYGAALNGIGYAQFTLASGIEARLIQAEAQLQPASAPSGPWLTTLNTLRANAAANTNGLVLMLPDTLHDPGAALSGAAAATARVNLLFQERAYWLFLDGHRQGDLRRLLRQYTLYPAFLSQRQVYPTGAYLAPGTGLYGSDINAPIPVSEEANPKFHGCISRAP